MKELDMSLRKGARMKPGDKVGQVLGEMAEGVRRAAEIGGEPGAAWVEAFVARMSTTDSELFAALVAALERVGSTSRLDLLYSMAASGFRQGWMAREES